MTYYSWGEGSRAGPAMPETRPKRYVCMSACISACMSVCACLSVIDDILSHQYSFHQNTITCTPQEAQEALEHRLMMRELDLPVDNDDMLADMDVRMALAYERTERMARAQVGIHSDIYTCISVYLNLLGGTAFSFLWVVGIWIIGHRVLHHKALVLLYHPTYPILSTIPHIHYTNNFCPFYALL